MKIESSKVYALPLKNLSQLYGLFWGLNKELGTLFTVTLTEIILIPGIASVHVMFMKS